MQKEVNSLLDSLIYSLIGWLLVGIVLKAKIPSLALFTSSILDLELFCLIATLPTVVFVFSFPYILLTVGLLYLLYISLSLSLTLFRCYDQAPGRVQGDIILRRSPTHLRPFQFHSLTFLSFPPPPPKRRLSAISVLPCPARLNTIPPTALHVASIPRGIEAASPWRRLRHWLEQSGELDSASPWRARRSPPSASSALLPSASPILSTTSLALLPSLLRPPSQTRVSRSVPNLLC